MYLKYFPCVIILVLDITTAFHTDADYEPAQTLDDIMPNDAPYGVKTGSHRKDSRTKTKSHIFKGGCRDRPVSPIFGSLQCSIDSGCRATCKNDYIFPNGEKQLAILCDEERWHIPGTVWDFVPHCEPICLPQCQNNGICIAPNQCRCSDNFSGPQCQFAKKPCLNLPPPILYSDRQCNSETCTVSCKPGFVFPDGSSIANLMCRNGNWETTRSDWVSIPDCEAVCSPPCQNGGICLALNTCQCPQDFRGLQCQYSSDRCSPQKLGFNGGYRCQGDVDIYSCTLNCPAGIEFTFHPAQEYTCTYDKGVFEPQPIPQCNIKSSDYQIVPLESSKNSYLKITNHSWTIEGSSISQISQTGIQYGLTNLRQEAHTSKSVYGSHILNEENSSNNIPNVSTMLDKTNFRVERNFKPEAKTCFTWGGVHYKTFDGEIYTFDSNCALTLIQESQDGSFTVTIKNSPECENASQRMNCHRILNLYIQGKEYSLQLNNNGVPTFRGKKNKILPIPAQFSGLRIEMSAHFVVVSMDMVGASLKWDGGLFVQIKASESLWNRTSGLCGRMNGDPSDDKTRRDHSHPKNIATFVADWKVDKSCDDNAYDEHGCNSNSSLAEAACKFCDDLFTDSRFQACSKTLDLAALQSTCQWDFCSCHEIDRRKCGCDTMNIYVRQCFHDKITKSLSWRREELCPMKCTGGRIYKPCGSKSQVSCGADFVSNTQNSESEDCEEGCFCPEGTVLHENKCITVEECPCRLRGKSFKPGTTIPKNCNSCTCLSGKWVCTQVVCGTRCAAVGDPHYTTFDGKRYDFMGKCSYYLVKGDNYSIEAENVACLGAISENMGLSSPDMPNTNPSCVKSVTIRLPDSIIKLKQNRQILINNDEATKFPLISGGSKVRIASSIFIVVHMPNNLEVWWDGISRAYINAPAEFFGKTKGLCGTFSNNQKDDFLTPDGDVEQSVVPFTNKWKTSEQCEDLDREITTHPCDRNPERLSTAEKHCSKIWSELFADCHWHVDPEEFYKDCKYDMCACEAGVERCLCPILAAYAKECAASGIKILWRPEVQECQLHCPAGQEYQICGNSCTRSCSDISFNNLHNIHETCRQECVEGCNCPEGQTLDNYGECIPIGQCPCTHEGMEFSAGHKEIRPGTKSQDFCICSSGIWSCRPASKEDIEKYPATLSLKTVCSSMKNLEMVNCEPVEPRTCRNMHEPISNSPSICVPACVCKEGYVLDSPSGNCVKEKECPCYHGGKSYKEGSTMQEECNTCKCENGNWKCTDRICPGICSVWGDSHYKTFDDKTYEFQGVCDYLLTKGSFGNDESFEVSTQNVPCGTSWVTCSKSITLTIGNGNKRESVTLSSGKPLPKLTNFQRIRSRYAGQFVFLDVPDLGLVVQWDKGTRVYIKLDPKWKGRTKGLCGDYNDNAQDDFKTPSGGIPEVSADIFGDSWKKDSYCPEPKEVTDTCKTHPERRIWAVEKCGILKTSLFQPCHSEVDIEPYVEKCIFDTCGCDQGGDCECLCTALSAYAHECNVRGVPVKWRSPEICPMQCDESCSNYSPCISTCPRETCDDLVNFNPASQTSHLCMEDNCVEGCLPKSCPDGQVYFNSSFQECVPRSTCKPICLEENGIIYYEGDKVSSDNCQTCFCSRRKIVCNGAPCIKSSPLIMTTIKPEPIIVYMEESEKCIEGWSAWLNRQPVEKTERDLRNKLISKDIEPLPTMIELLSLKDSAHCSKEQIIDIRCRTVDGHLTPKETGLDVECSLERGLYCKSRGNEPPCVDFEISVLCKCENESSTTARTRETPPFENCDVNKPNEPHPTDCHAFYQCVPSISGTELVMKTCGADMMYNPVMQICDWSYNVIPLRPMCGSIPLTTTPSVLETTSRCKKGEIWDECAIQCSKTCQYYRHQLKKQNICTDENDCIPGCISETKNNNCLKHQFWRDPLTCVDIADCNCISQDENSVKPGVVVEESECIRCQCLSNFYTCDESLCRKEKITIPDEIITTSSPIAENTMIIPSTVSPARACRDGKYNSLIEYFDSQSEKILYNASNSQVKTTLRDHSKYRNYWQSELVDSEQWMEIKLPKLEPIYGVVVLGNPVNDSYVTSYNILYSHNGEQFSYIPKIFQGPIDSMVAVKQFFPEPIEAKVVRINPQTWHQKISMRVDLIGCQDDLLSSTTPPSIQTTTTGNEIPKNIPIHKEEITKPICDEPMGLDNGIMIEEQVMASSSLEPIIPSLKLSSLGIWRPKLDNPHQYILFNFLANRNLTGIETKGADNIWTTAYNVYYGNDEYNWNPILDDLGSEKIFLGNFDDKTSKINYFEKPINAQYVKIQPIKWHEHVGLKVEIHGCFLPYPAITKKTEKIQVVQSPCNNCHEMFYSSENLCKCNGSLWWNGETCVEKHQCPCVVNGIPYNVGTIFETGDCQKCICTMTGAASCQQKICEPCDKPNMRSVVTELCGCVCKPCPEGSRLCPTSEICIDENSWCNGVNDCADDEKNCENENTSKITKNSTIIEVTTIEIKNVTTLQCERPLCPPGYKLVPVKDNSKKSKNSRILGTRGGRGSNRGKPKEPRRNPQDTTFSKKEQKNEADESYQVTCPQFSCVPTKPPPIFHDTKKPVVCPKVECPHNYKVIYEPLSIYKLAACPKYVCKPPPQIEVVCNITGRTFNTFDNLEYKYDICNHILARNMYTNEWYINLEKHCDSNNQHCFQVLAITVNDDVIVLHPDMHVMINEFSFSPKQVKRLGDKSGSFRISRIGNIIHFVCTKFGFWVIWDENSNVKIGITTKLINHVDGLCGYFDGNMENDRQMADGSQAKTSEDFGNSWIMDESPECNIPKSSCPRHIYEEAKQLCSSIMDRSFAICRNHMDLEKYVSRCLESSCMCLNTNSTNDECRCRALTSFATDCQASDGNIDLSTWRNIHNCPVHCPAPLVYKDCFRNKCECTCDNLQEIEPCPLMEGVCFPGCFCPDGTVRNGEDCIPASECRDCTCDGFGNGNFINFDKNNFTFTGNCTYILSQDTNAIEGGSEQHTFQILITNVPCPMGVCTEAISIAYKGHYLEIQQNLENKMADPVITVDGSPVEELRYNNNWTIITVELGTSVKILIPVIQLELTTFKHNFAFSLKLPSHIFGGAMEGLCGNCNANDADDLKKQNGEVTEDVKDFAMSWLATGLPQSRISNGNECSSQQLGEICLPPKLPEEDPCKNLLDQESFGQCNNVIDPTPYLKSCYDTLCKKGDICGDLEAYSRSCREAGFCPSWRKNDLCPYTCPDNLEYQSCGPNCPKTCETLNDPQRKEKCSEEYNQEGCYCAQNLVNQNGTCVREEKCFICDEFGHADGDVWHPDKCTMCSCNRKGMNCQKLECPIASTICEENFTPILVDTSNSVEECCPKYVCIPLSTTSTSAAPPICSEPQQPECGYGQIMKLSAGPDGCPKLICQCLPFEDCPLIKFENSTSPGFVEIINSTGCCPRAERICQPELCPPPPGGCMKYYKMESFETLEGCCLEYKCQPPKDLCLYLLVNSNDLTSVNNKSVIGKKIGEKWNDGVCKTCTCEKDRSDSLVPVCTTTTCPSIDDHPSKDDYVLMEKNPLPEECCPKIEVIACKDKKGISRFVGSEWHKDEHNACIIQKCENNTNGIEKKTINNECTTSCEIGYEYRESKNIAEKCCGECIPVACVINGTVKSIDETWQSEDFCINYTCLSDNGTLRVKELVATCEKPDASEEEKYEIFVDKIKNNCCPKYVRTGCKSNGKIYSPGVKWKDVEDSCLTHLCVDMPEKQQIELTYMRQECNETCEIGWEYEEPKTGDCCGKCKPAFCMDRGILHRPGTVWFSTDNCTTYECKYLDEHNKEQLIIHTILTVCPDVSSCPAKNIYLEGCCQKCNITNILDLRQSCAAEVLETESTVGILTERNKKHGLCRNLQAIESLTECRGACQSSTHFDPVSWIQETDCKCCQPIEMKSIIVNLTCDDGVEITKKIHVPTSCSCDACSNTSRKISATKGVKKIGIKG